MGTRRSFLVVFAVCAISYSVKARPATISSSEVNNHEIQRQISVGNDDRLTQSIHYRYDNNRGTSINHENDVMRGYEKSKDMEKAIKYMHKYGYIPVPNNPTSEMRDMTPKYIKENIKKMQMMMGVHVTGKLDDVTMAMIDTPRCGMHDPVDFMPIPEEWQNEGVLHIETSPQHFVHFGQKWPRTNITYRILNLPYSLNHKDTYTSIHQAFKVWSDVTPLTFTEVAGYADIYLRFGRYKHGDLYPFDGRDGTLAHAFLPQSYQGDLEGDVHFDDDEEFTYRSYEGINLFYVAAHEIGHAIGLHHSMEPSALMAPFINPYDPEFNLHQDDVAGIQDIYGKPSTTTNPDNPAVTQRHTTISQYVTTVHATTSLPPTKGPYFTREETITNVTALASDGNVSFLTEKNNVSSPTAASFTASSTDELDTSSSPFATVTMSTSDGLNPSSSSSASVTVSSSHETDTASFTSAGVLVSTTDKTDTSSSLSSSSFVSDSSSSSSFYSSDYSDSDQNENCPPYYTFFTGNSNDMNEVEPRGTVEENESSCDIIFDAVTSYRGEIFAFKGDRYWRITKHSGLISPSNGAYAAYFFESFPDDIDAAYEQYLTSKLFIFKGSNYYVFNGLSLESGPQPITGLDPSLPSHPDAVLTWGEWHKTYFFKGDLVWRYDEKRGRVDDGWPWLIDEIWTGVPNNLSAAFRWGAYTYFLQGSHLYAYDDSCYYVNPRDNPKSFSQEILGQQCPFLGNEIL